MTDPSERRCHFEEGAAFTELNTILKRLRRREPTEAERVRIAELREQINAMRRGQS